MKPVCGRTCACDDLCPRAEAAIDDDTYMGGEDFDGRLADGAAANDFYDRDRW